VLLYHSVGDTPWAVSEPAFREQVRWLGTCAQVEDLDRLLQDDASPGLRVAITFDDGYSSLAGPAARILREAGLSATVYLNTALIEELQGRRSDPAAGHYPDETFMTWREVETLREFGWTLGSHGQEHLDLTAQPADRVAEELSGSRQCLESRLGAPCRHFAYTWGRNTPALRKAVKDAGYQYAAAAVHGPLQRSFDPLAFPRVNIHRDYTLDDFAAIVRGDWDFLGPWQAWRNRRR